MEQALAYLDSAADILQEIGVIYDERATRRNVAFVHGQLAQWAEAEEQLLRVVAIGEAIGHPELESDQAWLAEVQARLAEP